uniref:Uncharacterized protein n=1 Tax=Tanacetum cinerariifolium TaxID=118510 RepID=A0A699HEW6_TANCI|nr:hypothetical protein [Tanacetum cinerariifolium]
MPRSRVTTYPYIGLTDEVMLRGAKEMRLFALWRGELPKLAAMANTPSFFNSLHIHSPGTLVTYNIGICSIFYETRMLAYYLLIAVSINLCAIKMVVILVVRGCDEYAKVRRKDATEAMEVHVPATIPTICSERVAAFIQESYEKIEQRTEMEVRCGLGYRPLSYHA